MKNTIIASFLTATLLLAACGKKGVAADPVPPSASSTTTTIAPATGPVATGGVSGPALAAWRDGDKAAAINAFLAADWSALPIFAADSLLSLNEEKFKAMPQADRDKGAGDMSATVNALRELSRAVMQAGRDAAAKGDADQARKCFTTVKACGTALDKQENLVVLIRFGQSIQRDAERELGKLGK